MIYYSIILNDELDFLKLQLELNYSYVDKFIITESELTFSGKIKPKYYWLNSVLFEKYKEKIIYLDVDLSKYDMIKNYPDTMYNVNDWCREKKQRDYCFKTIDFTLDDIVICVDVDEIVFLERCVDKIIYTDVNYFELSMRKYYMNSRWKVISLWDRAIALNPILYRQEIERHWHLRFIRNKKNSRNLIKNAGYHFSWCYDIDTKIKSFAHQEYNNAETIELYRTNAKNLTDCEIVNDLPEFIVQNYNKYIYR